MMEATAHPRLLDPSANLSVGRSLYRVCCKGPRSTRFAASAPAFLCNVHPFRHSSNFGGRRDQRLRVNCTLAKPAVKEVEAVAPSVASLADDSDFDKFKAAASQGNLVPVFARILSDQLTPVLAYRCLVNEDDRDAPSFCFESVVNGAQQGRYSFMGSQPSLEVIATGSDVTVLDNKRGTCTKTKESDPMSVPVRLSQDFKAVTIEGLPKVFTGGWVGYTGYDTVRYVYGGKLPFDSAPEDDRGLPDIHLALYQNVIVFDQATKLAYVIVWTKVDDFDTIEEAYETAQKQLSTLAASISAKNVPTLTHGKVEMSLSQRPKTPKNSNMTPQQFMDAVKQTQEYIQAGDIFQLVLSQRFERRTFADPFEIYRSLRVVNPSPYMVYLQARKCIVVSSSPEILCRVDEKNTVTNRPLAGTRVRGATDAEDVALEKELLADEKERAEHVMLVDLGRNDVGKVSKSGSVVVEKLMEIERYSHVMHISSTVTGTLQDGLDAWDALRAALPAGTVSGAPKVRAMQIIDELETVRRGPYGGGVGHVAFTGGMDIALALRTMVIPTTPNDTLYRYQGSKPRREWVVHLQAGAGIVADSKPEMEFEETVNKSAALGRAIDLAEETFVD